jgi:hypothetical protein
MGVRNRTFGLTWAAVLGLAGVAPLRHGHAMRLWCFWVSGAMLLLALAMPGALGPLNAAWTKLGRAIHRVMGPVTAGLAYYAVFTPVAMAMRRMGRDPLRLKFDPAADTYWIARREAGDLRRVF